MDIKFFILFLNSSEVRLSFTWGGRLFHNRLLRKAKELTLEREGLSGGRSNKSPRRKL